MDKGRLASNRCGVSIQKLDGLFDIDFGQSQGYKTAVPGVKAVPPFARCKVADELPLGIDGINNVLIKLNIGKEIPVN